MLKAVYTRTLTILKKVPVKLWGLSLLNGVVALIAACLCTIPIIALPIAFAIEAGMAAIYYKNYTEGVTPDAKPMFAAFKDFQTFKHIAGGMSWKELWLFIWLLVPLAGPFIVIYKSIQYIFTPYILLEEPSVRALDAIKKSKEYTKGYKGQIFLGIVLPCIIYFVVAIVLSLLALIPYVGFLFAIIYSIIAIIFSLFAPLFFGLVSAGFYEYCKRPARPVYTAPVTPAPVSIPANPVSAPAEPSATPAETITQTPVLCPTCGKENTPDKKFCGHCGAKL